MSNHSKNSVAILKIVRWVWRMRSRKRQTGDLKAFPSFRDGVTVSAHSGQLGVGLEGAEENSETVRCMQERILFSITSICCVFLVVRG